MAAAKCLTMRWAILPALLLVLLTGCRADYACKPTGEISVKQGGYILPYGGYVEIMKPVERYECSDGKDRWMAPMPKQGM